MWMHGLWWALLVLVGLVWTGLVSLARAVVGWSGWQQGGDWASQLPQLELPPWMVELLGLQWVDWMRALLQDWGPQLQAWLQGVDLAGWAGTGLTVVWVLGLAALLLLGALGSLALVLLRQGAPRLRAVMN